jgi:hypothetical protein
MKMPLSSRRGSLWIFILTVLFLIAGLVVMPAQGEQVSQVTFYVH